MGFKFASFGAATVPLSKIVIDTALDMGYYPLVGQRIMAPYRPYTWETETFQYDDRSPSTVVEGSKGLLGLDTEQLITTWTCDSPNACYVRALITSHKNYTDLKGARITVNGDTVYTTGSWAKGTTKTTDAIAISPGEVFELYVTGPGVIENYSLVETGYEAPINFDLKGRFLALDQDFGNLTATLTFGNDAGVPFSDYPNRFPYAPDKITLSRHKLEDRPVIKVYKETINWLEITRGWETETIQYHDTSPRTVVEGITMRVRTDEELVATWTCDSPTPRYVRAIIPTWSATYNPKSARIAINGVTVYTTGGWTAGETKTTDAVPVKPGDVFELYAGTSNTEVIGTEIRNGSIVDTGFEAPINIDLKGRFLALDQDFGDLTATLTFGDEENVPFTEYVNRFPCAPTKITVNTQKLEDRPVIKVYKGV